MYIPQETEAREEGASPSPEEGEDGDGVCGDGGRRVKVAGADVDPGGGLWGQGEVLLGRQVGRGATPAEGSGGGGEEAEKEAEEPEGRGGRGEAGKEVSSI